MRKKTLAMALAALLVLLGAGGTVLAQNMLEEIRAYLNHEVDIVLNGGPWQPKTGDTVLTPITYEGYTYLPVRAVAEALDVPIRYDAETHTIYIGESTEGVPILSETYYPISATITNDEQDRLIGGEDYGSVILFSKVLNSTSRFSLEPNGQYGKLQLKLAIEGADTRVRIVNVDGPTVLHSELITEVGGLHTIEADITGVRRIDVEVMAEEPNTSSALRIIADESFYY